MPKSHRIGLIGSYTTNALLGETKAPNPMQCPSLAPEAVIASADVVGQARARCETVQCSQSTSRSWEVDRAGFNEYCAINDVIDYLSLLTISTGLFKKSFEQCCLGWQHSSPGLLVRRENFSSRLPSICRRSLGIALRNPYIPVRG